MAGLYLHIPFCVKKCDYCDFVSFAAPSAITSYLAALRAEMELYREECSSLIFDTVFFGGGTPSILPPGCIAALMEALRENFHIAKNAECSIECNPGTADAEKLAEYFAAGVNRISFGLQSACDPLLKRVGRIHTFAQFLAGVETAKNAGFSNLSADVIYGLPGQTLRDHLHTLRELSCLELPHISAYSLILEENTPLFFRVEAGEETLPEEDAVYAMHRANIEFLAECGYRRYEISNYEKGGHACRHNLNYWDNGPYLGLGLAAHSALREGTQWVRHANTEELAAYTAACRAGEKPLQEEQRIDRKEEMFECVMLGLRKTEGLCRASFYSRFHSYIEDVYPAALMQLRENGWLKETETHFALNDRGLDLQNEALLLFME